MYNNLKHTTALHTVSVTFRKIVSTVIARRVHVRFTDQSYVHCKWWDQFCISAEHAVVHTSVRILACLSRYLVVCNLLLRLTVLQSIVLQKDCLTWTDIYGRTVQRQKSSQYGKFALRTLHPIVAKIEKFPVAIKCPLFFWSFVVLLSGVCVVLCCAIIFLFQ